MACYGRGFPDGRAVSQNSDEVWATIERVSGENGEVNVPLFGVLGAGDPLGRFCCTSEIHLKGPCLYLTAITIARRCRLLRPLACEISFRSWKIWYIVHRNFTVGPVTLTINQSSPRLLVSPSLGWSMTPKVGTTLKQRLAALSLPQLQSQSSGPSSASLSPFKRKFTAPWARKQSHNTVEDTEIYQNL
jgi:hypothetical protein